MRRQLCWTERQEDGAKREVRVSVQRRALKWQFKLSTEAQWDCDHPPFPADWDQLLTRIEALYRRRSAPYGALLLVRRLRDEALRAEDRPPLAVRPGALRLTTSAGGTFRIGLASDK